MVESKRPVDVFVDVLIHVVIVIACFLCLIPLLNTLALSFSSSVMASSGTVSFWPKQFTLAAYEAIVGEKQFFGAFWISIKRVVLGGTINFLMMVLCAFPLAHSEKAFRGRNVYMYILIFTMLFSGGLVPTYLLARNLHLLNTRWALIIPGAMGVYQMIVTRTFLVANIPQELLEMSQIDGCNDFRFFWSFVLPLSKAVIAVTAMQYAVGHWNSWFSAFLYLSDDKKYPLQMMLRRILVMNQIKASDYVDEETLVAMEGMADLLKYSLIVVATVPILCAYPFIQKYFVKGIMIGSLKG